MEMSRSCYLNSQNRRNNLARAIFQNAILSGKLGDTVYARNKGGYYVRAYVPPVQPDTVAQTDARDSFSASSLAWNALTASEHAAWNAYANEYFKAKKPNGTVSYSGRNAFISLRNAVANGNRKTRPHKLYADNWNILAHTSIPFLASNTPMLKTFSPNIKTFKNIPLSIKATNFLIRSDGVGRFTIRPLPIPNPQAAAPIFRCPVTNQPVGYVLIASNILAHKSNFVQNPHHTIIGAFPPPTITWGWLPTYSSIIFFFYLADPSIPDHLVQYNIGDIVRLEAWALSLEGSFSRIGSEVFTIIS